MHGDDNGFGDLVYVRSYARWLEDEQRREVWEETCQRYRNYFLERFDLSDDMRDNFSVACDRVLNKEIVPSMRCLWTAGKALDVDNIAGFNCFGGDTEILTFENGRVRIEDAVGYAKVLNSNGEWVDSVVKSFGIQSTVEAKFGYNAYTILHRVTLDHEWVLEDGRRVTTNNLEKGDRIKFNAYKRKDVYDSIDYRLGLIHGLIYADGTAQYKAKNRNINCICQRRVRGYTIRICADHDDLLPVFEGYSRSYPPSANGDPIVYVWDNFAKTHSLKDLPAGEHETEDYLVGFFRGWFAGDGYVAKDGQVSLSATGEGVEWLEKFGSRFGYLIQSVCKLPDVTNYGTRNKSIFNVHIDRKCIGLDDVLIKRKQDRLRPIDKIFTFRGIVPESTRSEEVFCAVVPDTHTFTLADGMITGNCSYVLIDSIKSFADLIYLLLNGTGVGYSVERQVITKLPAVPDTLHESSNVVVFGDSKLGWAEGLLEYMTEIFNGSLPQYDLSLIRPKGARLKTFGGRAGGSGELKLLLDYIKSIAMKARGRKLTSLECHDICCFIANVVVSAGIRRSACISLSNLSDTRMRDCKVGEFWLTHPHRQLCNNSVAYTEKPDMKRFMQEWMALMNSGSGERGIFNREGAMKQFEKLGRDIRDSDGNEHNIGINPCFTGDMEILTDTGYKKFRDLSGKDVNLINIDGKVSRGQVWHSGIKRIVEVKFHGDTPNIKCTPDHTFMLADHTECKAENLKKKRVMPFVEMKTSFDKESFLAGFIQGDGMTGRLDSDVHRGLEVVFGKNDIDVAKMFNQHSGSKWYSRYAYAVAKKYGLSSSPLPTRELPKEMPRDFLSGLYSANGSVIKHSRVAYKTSCKQLADRLVDELSTRYGIEAYITTNKKHDVQFSNGVYTCKENYDVNIGKYSSLVRFAKYISFAQNYKVNALYDLLLERAPFVDNVVDCGTDNVYDFSEPLTNWGVVNGVVVHNCGEVVLRPNEACNLSEVIVRPEDTLETLINKVESATVLGCMQSCLTDIHFLDDSWKKNMEEERLLGVSLTGVRDHPILNHVSQLASLWLTTLREHIHKTAIECANALGINVPIARSCTKPSGTVSSVMNCASGIHTRFAPYYIRRIRIARTDVLCTFLQSIGVPNHPEVGQDEMTANTFVFEFPIKSPENAVFDTPAIEQLEYWRMFKTCYTDHNPSVTITVADDEWMEVGAWVYKNWDIVGGLSFLPKSDTVYQLMPYEEISKEEYNKRVADMPELDFSKLTELEKEDETTGAQTFACTGGSCDVY